jgi:hypothetical protein
LVDDLGEGVGLYRRLLRLDRDRRHNRVAVSDHTFERRIETTTTALLREAEAAPCTLSPASALAATAAGEQGEASR